MSKHDDDRITPDDLFMNVESFEQMILDSIHTRDEDCHDEESEERIVSFAQQRRAERLRKWSKNENEK